MALGEAVGNMWGLCVLLTCVSAVCGQQSYLNIYANLQADNSSLAAENCNSSATEHPEDRLCLRAIFDGPLFILAPTAYRFDTGKDKLKLAAYYADKGISSIVDYTNFTPLLQLLLANPHTSGLAYPGHAFNSEELLHGVIEKMMVPDGFRMLDLLDGLRHKNIHVVYVAPKDFFDRQGFTGLSLVAKYVANKFTVDLIESVIPIKPPPKEPKIKVDEEDLPNLLHGFHRPPPPLYLYHFAPPESSYLIDNDLFRRYRMVAPNVFGNPGEKESTAPQN